VSLGKRLKRERERKGWSQLYVAEKLGITNAVLSNYERDYRDPDTDTLTKLADLYDVSIDYLLGRIDNPSPSSNPDIPPNINVAYLGGVKHELTPEVARRLKEDIELFERLKKQFEKEQQDK